MATLICTRGLPASGKTTAALAWVAENPENRVRVGRDPLRDLLYGTRKGLTNDQENFITKIQTQAVEKALSAGKDVVVDDLHLRLNYLTRWLFLAAHKGYGFEVWEFDTDMEDCIWRDRKRHTKGEPAVGVAVIEKLAKRFRDRPVVEPLAPVVREPYVPNPALPDAIVVDIDGTLAIHNGRSPYDYSLLHTDKLDGNVAWVVRRAALQGRVIVMSGRPNEHRALTERWLSVNGVPWDMLFMRPTGDNRDDALVKYELFDREVRPYFNVRAVFDDRDRVVDMWRSIGLTCLQVNYGDF